MPEENNIADNIEEQAENQVEAADLQDDNQEDSQQQGYLDYETYVENGGDPNNFKGPKAFEDFGKLLNKIDKLEKANRMMEHTNHTVLNEFQNIRLRERESLYEKLYTERAAAIELGDAEKIDDLTNKLQRVAYDYHTAKANVAQSSVSSYEQEFIKNHPDWFPPGLPYDQIVRSPKYQEAQQQVQLIAYELRSQGKDPNQHLDEILAKVEERVGGGAIQAQSPVEHTKPKVNISQNSNVNRGLAESRSKFSSNQRDEIEALNKQNSILGLPPYTDEQARAYIKKYGIK